MCLPRDCPVLNRRMHAPHSCTTHVVLDILQYYVVVVGDQCLVTVFDVVQQLPSLVLTDCPIAFRRLELDCKAAVVNV